MKRNVIKIDEGKCVGCGACATACRQSVIGIVDGKAKVLRADYCDGLGNCLPVCPAGAISFETKEVKEGKQHPAKHQQNLPCGCPGTNARVLEKNEPVAPRGVNGVYQPSALKQWPVQIKLVPCDASYFDGARLLIAADCAAYAYACFHADFMEGKVTLIGCPKLDNADYSEKLAEIIKNNDIKSITVARMEVPCCAGLEEMVKQALIKSGKVIPWDVRIITAEGAVKDY